jgi:ribosomal protein L7/L12
VQVKDLVAIARKSATVEDALVQLHEAGASPIQAIKALREGKGLALGEAKLALHASPAWHKEAREAEEFHDELFKWLDEGPDL